MDKIRILNDQNTIIKINRNYKLIFNEMLTHGRKQKEAKCGGNVKG